MANRWRGYRLITVQEQRFRWKCCFHEPAERFSRAFARRGPAWSQDKLLVRLEEDPACLLTVVWSPCSGPVVTPRLVRQCIEKAIEQRWLDDAPVLSFPGSTVTPR